MAGYYQLSNFDIRLTGQGNTVILFSDTKKYYDVLVDAFPSYRFSRLWPNQYNNQSKYRWGTYINSIGDEARQEVRALLDLLQQTIYIDDALKQTFALSSHGRPRYLGGGRTEIGDLTYYAKYHQDRDKAFQLVGHLANFISRHPGYRRSDFILAVPFYGHKPFDLPTFLAEQICIKLSIKNGQGCIRKVKETKPMKNLSREEKFENVRDAYEVMPDIPIQGRLITVIDDVYQSGETLHAVASVLQRAGATVHGLTATKTVRISNLDT